MCSGAMLYHGMRRLVVGEHRHKVGEEAMLASRGVTVLVADRQDCFDTLEQFITTRPDVWDRISGISQGPWVGLSARAARRSRWNPLRAASHGGTRGTTGVLAEWSLFSPSRTTHSPRDLRGVRVRSGC